MFVFFFFFFFKQKTAYEMLRSLVGSEMCIRDRITTLGQFLDPLADKLLIAAALIALVSQGRIAVWVAMLIIGREVAVSVLRIVGVSQGVSIPADRYGKLKTVLQIVYVVYVLVPTDKIADLINVSTDVATIIQWVLAGVVVVVT